MIRELRMIFTLWLSDPFARFQAWSARKDTETVIELLPIEERADPLGLHTHAVAPSQGVTDVLCPKCHVPVPARKFSSHLWYCEVKDWPYGEKPKDQKLDY